MAPSTVSRAFSRPGRVNAETAQRIREVATELGYRSRTRTTGLPPTGTRILGLVVQDITNPFYAEIIRGAESAAAEAGFTLLLSDAEESQRLEREAIERAMPAVQGLILTSTRMPEAAIRVLSKQRPIVVLNRAVPDVHCIVTDTSRGVRRAAEHLRELGHESVTYVAGPSESWADGIRWSELVAAAAELGLRARRVGPFAPTLEGGAYAAQELAADGDTAALCYNDLVAVGVIRGLQRLGRSVPEDVSVIGFDNTLIADLSWPSLTTVSAPLRLMGSAAVQTLLTPREDWSPAGQPTVLPTRLVQRASTGLRRRP
ncbi:LacI family transcription regulator [Knoellia sinensis KCTC 19936]|uniref:LacI family transcription regulator n=1 Tax=Knoellia sinensis KCTC 19936 TaxID=1385520 RepID=A0A0A0J5Y5_9MICO|nr:LacI family transcription regulator [Knoellia sinensis KCTC 19936]